MQTKTLGKRTERHHLCPVKRDSDQAVTKSQGSSGSGRFVESKPLSIPLSEHLTGQYGLSAIKKSSKNSGGLTQKLSGSSARGCRRPDTPPNTPAQVTPSCSGKEPSIPPCVGCPFLQQHFPSSTQMQTRDDIPIKGRPFPESTLQDGDKLSIPCLLFLEGMRAGQVELG